MKRLFILLTISIALCGTTSAQMFKSESTRKAGEQLAKGNIQVAIDLLTKAIEARKDLLEAYHLRGNLNAMGGNLTAAIADYSSALEIDPTQGQIYESRALYRGFRRDWAGALKDYDLAIINGVKSDRIYLRRATIKRDMGDIDGAVVDFRAAVSFNPNMAGAYVGLSQLLEQKGEIDTAIVMLQDFLDRYERNRDGKLPETKGTVTGSINIKRKGQEKDGSQAYLVGATRSIETNASSSSDVDSMTAKMEQTMNLSLAYFGLGRLYAKKDDLEKALQNYDKGLKINKDDPLGYKLRSEIKMKKGDLTGTIEDLRSAVNSPMHLPDNHRDKGILLLLQGNDAEARTEFDLHLQRFPAAKEALEKQIAEAKKLRDSQK